MDVVLRIKKRSRSEWAIGFILVLTLCYGIIDLIGVPAIKYTMDITWLFLLATLVANRFSLPNRETKDLFNCMLAFLAITVVSAVLNSWVPQYYLWGFRNNFRFFVFFLSCAKFIDAKNIDAYLKTMNKVFYLHFVVAMIQYFIFGISGDHLGGIFGTQEGNNGFSLAFMLIMLAYSMLCYLKQQEKLWTFVGKGIMAILIAAFSELKLFFAMCFLIAALCILITRFTYKKLVIIIATAAGVVFGTMLLSRIFPNWKDWFSLEYMLESAITDQGYTGSGDLNRLTAISAVWDRFLVSWHEKLFGLGLGNCDTAAYSFLTTPFYNRYNYLHYHWFSSSFTILETGAVGFVVYLLFFVLIYLGVRKREQAGMADTLYCQLAKVTVFIALALIIYNNSMRTEPGYMVYFVLALPFIDDKKHKR